MASVSVSNTASNSTPPIQTIPANSSFIAAFEYDQANMRLTAHLKNGAIYQHTFVTSLDWEALKTAKNHGSHWGRAIKGQKLGIKIKSAKAPKSGIKTGGR